MFIRDKGHPGSVKNRWYEAGWLVGLMALAFSVAGSDTVYKCVEGGKTRFTSSPMGSQGSCEVVDLKVVKPNPVEVARQLERKRLLADQEKALAEQERQEQKNKEYDEALRKARSAKEALQFLRENPPPVREGGLTRTFRGLYPHKGEGPPERYTVNVPPKAREPAPAAPAGTEQKH